MAFKEAILKKTGAQPFEISNLAAYYLAFIGMGAASGIVGPTLPALAERGFSTVGTFGILFSVRSLGYLIGTLTLARLLDRFKPHLLMGLAQVGAGLCLAGVAWMHTLPQLIALFFIATLLESVISVGTNTSILWTFKRRSGPLINGLHAFFGMGAFLSPLLVARLLSLDSGLKTAYWVVGGIFILSGLWMLRLPCNPHPPVESKDSEVRQSRRSDGLLIVMGALFLFFYVGAEVSFGGWYYTYLTGENLVSVETGAYLVSLFWFTFTVGRLASVWVVTKLTPQRLLPIALVGALAGISLLMFRPAAGSTLLWVTPLLLGFCLAPIFPTAYSWISQVVPLNGKLTGYLYLGDSMGAMILPWLIGRVIDSSGAGSMVGLIIGSLAMNLVMYFVLLRAVGRVKTAQAVQ